jgi:hypothetical protein
MNSGTKKEAFFVFLLLAFTYVYFYHDPGWNGNDRLGLTFAIVEEGRLTIDSFHNREGTFTNDKAFYNGHYYSSKAIGSSLIAVFFYFPLYQLENLLDVKFSVQELKYLLTILSIGVPSAIAGSLIYVLCKQVTGDRFRSYVFTIAINLGTMIFPFSVIFFGHQLVGTFLFGAFFLIFQLKIDLAHHRKSLIFLVGLLLGFALITEYPIAPIVLVLTIYYFNVVFTKGVINRNSAVIMPALGACIPIAILLAYNTAAFGNPISTGYTYPADPWFQQEQSQGIAGIGWPNPKAMFFMTIHPAFGLLWQSPVLIMSLVGMWRMLRKSIYRVEALISLTAFLLLLIIYSGFPFWWGGWTFGPRYLVPMLTFMCLPLVFLPKRWFSSVVLFSIISIMHMFIAVSSQIIIPDDFIKQIDKVGYFSYSSIYSYCLKLLLEGSFSENLGIKFLGLNPWVSLFPILLALVVISLFFYLRRDNTNSSLSPKEQASI